jgi:flagellar basal-body rod protein FlgG
MDKTLRTASTGLTAQQRYVETISNNLANINTFGFKKIRPEFQDLLYENLRPAGNVAQTGSEPLDEVQIGSGTQLVSTSKIFSQGDLQQSNNPLDIGINGEGFFILRKPDNSLTFSRDGSFKLDRNGLIVNSQGYQLEPGFTIPNDAIQVNIGADGVVSILTEGSVDEETLGQMELARFINPGGLRALGNNLYAETPASGQAIFEQPGINNTGELVQAHIEASNVDIVEEMVNMITAQRAYELNSKSVQTADGILSTAVNLKR